MAVDTVEVWTIWSRPASSGPASSGPASSGLAELERVLDDEELERARALVPDRRRRFVVAHAATRIIVGRYLGVPPERLRWRRGRHGKPELAGEWTGARVNLSHSGELAVLAVTARRSVGVDVQELRGVDVRGMSARFFPPDEAAYVAAGRGPLGRTSRFTRLWTRKEACVKGAGGRLTEGLALPVRGPAAVLVRGPALTGPFLVRDVPVPDGFHAAVAMAGPEPFRVVRRPWSAPP